MVKNMKSNILAVLCLIFSSYSFSVEIDGIAQGDSYLLYKSNTFSLVKVNSVKKWQEKIQHHYSTVEWVPPEDLHTNEKKDRVNQTKNEKNSLTKLILGNWIWEQEHKMVNITQPRGIYVFKADGTVKADLEIFNWKCKGNYEVSERYSRDYILINMICNGTKYPTIKLAIHNKTLKNKLILVPFDLDDVYESDLITFIKH